MQCIHVDVASTGSDTIYSHWNECFQRWDFKRFHFPIPWNCILQPNCGTQFTDNAGPGIENMIAEVGRQMKSCQFYLQSNENASSANENRMKM